jgi:hypothetical protein
MREGSRRRGREGAGFRGKLERARVRTVEPPRVAQEALLRACHTTQYSGSGETVVRVPFSFDVASPLILQALTPGQVLNRAAIQVITPFSDPAARVKLGTTATPGLVFTDDDVELDLAEQYESSVLFPFFVSDFLILTVSPGASTAGSGLLLYKIR